MDLEKLLKSKLLEICKELNIKNYKSKPKKELIKLINDKKEVKEEKEEEKENNYTLETLKKVLNIYTIKKLSELLFLAPGTIKRWLELKDVPKCYEIDLLKLCGEKIDYSKYNSKEKDQFFTPINTAEYCYNVFKETLKKYEDEKYERDILYIEPCAGDGNFLSVLPKDTIALDIEPKHHSVKQQDYLEWNDWKEIPENKKIIVFGNPPFGLRGNMALRFINHSNNFADYVCFILPQLFESDGKGVPRKRVKGFNLIHSEKLNTNFLEPNGSSIEINTIFQIWSKNHTNEDYIIKNISNDKIKIYSLSDGGTSSSTRNLSMINNCDIYLPSTCFGKENMRVYDNFESLPGRKGYGIVFEGDKEEKENKIIISRKIDWSSVSFLSTNSAYNLRVSSIQKAYL